MAMPSNDQVQADQSLNTPVDTTSETQTTPQVQPSESHGEDQTPGATTQPTQEAHVDREANKMSKLERERNEALQKVQEVEARQQTWIEWSAKNPTRYKKALVEIGGLSEQEAESKINEIRSANPSLWSQQQTSTQQTDPRAAVREEIERIEAFKRFTSEFPEMDLRNIKPEEASIARAKAVAVDERVAEIRRKESIDLGDAYIRAYRELFRSSDLEKVKEEGELEGLAKANYDNATTMSSPTGKGSSSKGNFGLSQQEMETAKKFGMSFEEYAKNKSA